MAKVVSCDVYYTDSVGQWDAESVSQLQTTLQASGQDIIAEAAAYQVDLSFSFHYYNAQMTGDICSGDYSNDWQDPALKSAGLPSLNQLHNYLVQTHSAKEAPVVFVFNKTGRAYASNGANEFFVLFAKEKNNSFQHELSHVFGEKDYYYPAEVKTLASGCFSDSVMNKGKTADSLTAYLIGWTDTVTDNALQFLQSTNSLTSEYMRQEIKRMPLPDTAQKSLTRVPIPAIWCGANVTAPVRCSTKTVTGIPASGIAEREPATVPTQRPMAG